MSTAPDDSPGAPGAPGTPTSSAGPASSGTPTSSAGPTGPTPPPRHGTDGFFDSVRGTGLLRTSDRWVGGVAGGLARRFAIDPVVVRGLVAVSFLLGGVGLVLYGIAWLLLPEEADGRIHAQQLLRGDVNVAAIGAIAAVVIGLSMPEMWLPWVDQDVSGFWRGLGWLTTVALIVVVVVVALRSRPRGTPPSTSLPRTGAPGAPASGPAWPSGPASPTGTTPMSGVAPPPPTAANPGGMMSTPDPDPTSARTEVLPVTGGPTTAGWEGNQQQWTAAADPGRPAWTAGAPGWTANQPGWNPPPPAWNPGPTTALPTRRRAASGPVVAVVLALSLLGAAGLLYAERVGAFTGPVALTVLTGALALVGLGIVAAGLTGRRAGGLTALAIIGGLVLAAAVTDERSTWEFDGATGVGDVSLRPTTVTSAESGISLGLGDADLDLRDVPLTDGETITVPIELGAGDLDVLLPADAAVRIEVELGAGSITWPDDASVGGTAQSQVYESADVRAGATPQLELVVQAGLGDVTFEEN